MDSSIENDYLRANIQIWPANRWSVLLNVLLILLICIIFCLRKMIKDYRNQAQNQKDLGLKKANSKINIDWLFFAIFLVAIVYLVGFNSYGIIKSMHVASDMSDAMTLDGDKVIVVPDYVHPSKQRYLVTINSDPVAYINNSGYQSTSKVGSGLHKLSNHLYNTRYTLKSYQQENMFGKNNRIHLAGNKLIIQSWKANGKPVMMSVNRHTGKVSSQKMNESDAIPRVAESTDGKLPFGNPDEKK